MGARTAARSIADLFAEDADFVNVVGLWWRTREDIREAHAYGLERIFSGSAMRILETKVRELGDVAVVHGRWEMAWRQPAARTSAPSSCRR